MLKSMCKNISCCEKNCKDWAILILRIAVGIVFVYHGFGKLFGTPGIEGFSGMLTSMNFPIPEFLAYLVGVIEFVGGIALILGAYVQPFSILLAVIMAVAFIVVKKFNFGKGELDFILFMSTIALAVSGSGKYSAISGCKVCDKNSAKECCGSKKCCDDDKDCGSNECCGKDDCACEKK